MLDRVVHRAGPQAIGTAATLWRRPAGAQDITLWTLNFSSRGGEWRDPEDRRRLRGRQSRHQRQIVTRGVDEHKTALRVAARLATRARTSTSAGPASASAASTSRRASACRSTNTTTEYKWSDELVPAAAAFADIYPGRQARRALHLQGRGALLQQERCSRRPASPKSRQTYDELLAAAEKLKAAGIPAITFGGTVNWHVMRLMDVILEAKCGAEKHDALMAMNADWTDGALRRRVVRRAGQVDAELRPVALHGHRQQPSPSTCSSPAAPR